MISPDGSIGATVTLLAFTASHRDLDLDMLEQLSPGARSVGREIVADSPDVTGCVVLATCNRFEVYVDHADGDGDAPPGELLEDGVPVALAQAVAAAVATASGTCADDVAEGLRPRSGDDVARHLFAVASGLDSMVVGEREVAGQVRRALAAARSEATTTAHLERLFQTASRTSRAVGSRTALGAAGRSVVGVALDIVAERVGLRGASVLLVGTGSYAGASLAALRARGAHDVAVHSPSGRGEQFAAERGVDVVTHAGLADALARADVVVSCSGAHGVVVDVEAVRTARARRGGSDGGPRPLAVVDLALRHDVDPAVRDVPGVLLVDLQAVQRHAPTVVGPEVERGWAIVEEAVRDFGAALAETAADPAVVALRRHVDALVAAELDRVRATGADAATVADVERSVRRLAARILHRPTVLARASARQGRHAEHREALTRVFGDLDQPTTP